MAPLRSRPFRWYFASRSINLIGNNMAPVAIAFAVLAVSHSPIALGLVLAARTIPLIVFLLIGGVIADRWGRARVILGSNLISGISQAVTATLVLTHHAQLWHLVVLSAINGIAAAAGLPAMNGLIPQLVPRDQLQEANVLTSLTRAILAVVGPTIAAALVVTPGAGWALALDAATWLVAAALVAPIRIPAATGPSRPPILGQLRTGWDYFRSTTWLWLGVGATAILNALYEGGFLTLGPLRAERTDLGAHGWGLTLSTQGVGVLLATLALMRWRLHRPLLVGMVGMALFGLPMVALGLHPSLGVVLVAAFLSGIGIQVFSLGWQLAMQENVPGDLLSRASSYDQLGSYAAIPIGQLCLGPLAAVIGLGEVLFWAGALYVAVSLLVLLSRSVRELARVVPSDEPAVA